MLYKYILSFQEWSRGYCSQLKYEENEAQKGSNIWVTSEKILELSMWVKKLSRSEQQERKLDNV